MSIAGLTFGAYPLGIAGTPTGLATGPQDDFEKIQSAFKELQGNSAKVLARNYILYMGPGSEERMLGAIEQHRQHGILADLTLGCYQEPGVPLDGWREFIRQVVRQFGKDLDLLQITNEPNLSFMEGSKPFVVEALVGGVLAAKEEIKTLGLTLPVGFGSVPSGPAALPNFWKDLANFGGQKFAEAVDFVGHNFYVDVFEEPLPLEKVPSEAERILRDLRENLLPVAGIPATVPIHITENGWPTGKNAYFGVERTYEQQASVLETVVRTVYRLRTELNITHYEFFELRDADSHNDDIFHQFGLLRDDYSPKPAFMSTRT